MSDDSDVVGFKPVLSIFGLVFLIWAFVCAGVLGFFIGWAKGDRNGYHRVFVSEQAKIEPILAASSEYSNVHIEERETGNADLVGQVPSEESLARLQREMRRLFGEDRAAELTTNIAIAGQKRRE